MACRPATGWWLVQVVDTTGAGDCFTGAVAVGILEGMSYQEAMKFAGGSLFSVCLPESSWMLCIHYVHCSVRGYVVFVSNIACLRFHPLLKLSKLQSLGLC